MFILVVSVLYDQYHTRLIRYYRGIAVYMHLFSLIFFIQLANPTIPSPWILGGRYALMS